EQRLKQLDNERQQVAKELLHLQQTVVNQPIPKIGKSARETIPQTSDEKIDLFLSLFRCRESVYPKLWENSKQDRKGYSPACNNEWVRGLCGKPPNGNVK